MWTSWATRRPTSAAPPELNSSTTIEPWTSKYRQDLTEERRRGRFVDRPRQTHGRVSSSRKEFRGRSSYVSDSAPGSSELGSPQLSPRQPPPIEFESRGGGRAPRSSRRADDAPIWLQTPTWFWSYHT